MAAIDDQTRVTALILADHGEPRRIGKTLKNDLGLERPSESPMEQSDNVIDGGIRDIEFFPISPCLFIADLRRGEHRLRGRSEFSRVVRMARDSIEIRSSRCRPI